MIEWEPISEAALRIRIAQGKARMSSAQLRLWNLIRVEPAKWKQEPYGKNGGGFWAVGVIGKSVIWYNDLEDGFNRSSYSSFGTIDDYWCNQDELEVAIGFLLNALESGQDLVQLRHQVPKRPR